MIPLLRQVTVTRTTRAWIEVLEAAGVPCGPINRVDQVFDALQVQARGLQIKLPDPTAGTVPLVANPIRLSDTPIAYDRAPPRLGEHTDEVLSQWLGLEREAIGALRASAVT
ncbi:MAG TPA: CoA transferase [Candidatus Tectomicrobia bacterium]